MNTGLISSRYAHALYDYALQKNAEERVYVQAKLLAKGFSQFVKLKSVLNNPVLGNLKKKEIILLTINVAIDPVFDRFIDMVLENNREDLLHFIALKYVDVYRKNKNIFAAKLTTAIEIDPKTEKTLIRVIENYTKGTLELDKAQNPDILGGFALEVDNTRWDATIAGQLRKIKKGLLEL